MVAVNACIGIGRTARGAALRRFAIRPYPKELEQQVRDEVVLREMFMQEAEKRGLAASADYKAQMEFARQSILIRELFDDFRKKNPVTDEAAMVEYDKFKSQSGGLSLIHI